MSIIPAYYKDGVPYDASGKVITTGPENHPAEPLVTDLGDGKFQFKSQTKACYLKNLNAFGWTWVMDRGDEYGVAICFCTKAEQKVAVTLLTGQLPAPAYTQEQADTAALMLSAPGAMLLSSGQWSMLLSVAGEGVMTLAGEIGGMLTSAVSRAVALLTASSLGPMAAAASVLLFSSQAGKGSDRVPGRDTEAMFALNARLLAGQRKINPGSASINLPVRGALIERNGEMVLELLKTGDNVPAAVPVLNAVRDAVSGLDIIRLPAMPGTPPRTILINPVPGSAKPSDTGNRGPVPNTPVHTGTDVKPVGNITLSPPVGNTQQLQDFIYWRPDASGTGVVPIYVVISGPRDRPGRVSGKGENVGTDWLNKAGQGPGAPIPGQIAERLLGREFSSFDAFRKAFWLEVGKDPELSKQFKAGNLGNIRAGKAPAPKESEQKGRRVKYELHHVKPIKDNGEIYNIDNIRVTTPKCHIENHKGSK
ncbi:S-type pyocin domain-containing protein [Erwinia tasmaniensis]|uniref:S-type pyocin domain-containing protein n=1 Tax=Erwinia tasmaniensis TaxID=338565 RepID=UPI003A4E4EA5